jgi:integrase
MAKRTTKTKDGVYTPKGRSGFWISWVDAQGRRRRRKTDAQNITQAKQARAAELLRVEQARMLGFNPPGEERFAQVADRYLTDQKARLTPFFAVKLSGIRRADIQRYITSRAGKASPYSIQKETNLIKHVFRLAVECEILPYSPAQGVKSQTVPAGRVRYLQPTELGVLLKAAPEWLRSIIALAVTTGMRRGEILALRWLESEAKPTDKLFPTRADWVTGAFRRVCAKIGLEDFRFHDLRHTAASWLRMQGADIHTVAQILGHKDLRMAARYQHLSPTFLAEAVNRLNGVFGDSVGGLSHQGVTKLLMTPSDLPVND